MSVEALDKFRDVYRQNPQIVQHRGRETEADTRANILDRLIHEVLEWPRKQETVAREPFANPGFIDYQFSHGRPLLLLEAKASGISFGFPYRKNRRRSLKIETSLLTDKELAAAITQAQKYCSDTGCKFALVTNGYSYVFFKAIVDGVPWKSGAAIIFYDFKDIETNFTEFWNLLSYEAVVDGKLEAAFRTPGAPSRGHYKPLDERVDADATYDRNPLSVFIRPYVSRFFGDIAAQDAITILEKCYVYSKPVQVIDRELKLTIEDHVPAFAASTKPIAHTATDPGGQVGRQITSAVTARDGGAVILVMGGIGSGKSTFCRRFFKVVAPGLVRPNGKAMLVYLDFLGAPDDANQLDDYVWKKTAESLKAAEAALSTRPVLEQIFKADIDITSEVYGASDPDTHKKINDLIFTSFMSNLKFGEAALKHCVVAMRMPLVVFDNVDQLRLESQVQLFATSQRFARAYGCVAILVLREESYSSAQLKRHLTATTIRPYHLSSPDFKEVIATRIRSAILAAKEQAASPEATVEQKDYADIVLLFDLLERSVLGRNANIIRLVQSVAYGNIRLALDLFNSFITSGATNVEKIINTYRVRGGYTVPFHEFAKSVMLGDFLYYRDSRSLICNLFEVSRKPNASHFTAMRVLSYLLGSPMSHGGAHEWMGLQELLTAFDEAFANDEDCKEVLLRLASLNRQLIDFNTRKTDSLEGASELRITAAGKYYFRFLVNAFGYCDLVWHDTPFSDRYVCDTMERYLGRTWMSERFARVDEFLAYLRKEEETEFSDRGIYYEIESVWGPFVPRIKRHVEHEKAVIKRRLGNLRPSSLSLWSWARNTGWGSLHLTTGCCYRLANAA